LTFSDTFGRDYTSAGSNANHQIAGAASIAVIACALRLPSMKSFLTSFNQGDA
jgi:hypothetical protein